MSKMKGFILFCLFLIQDGKADDREPKFFFGPKIQTVVSYKRIPEFITEFVPSSCVVIEPTLLPCRHVRNLEIYPSVPTRMTKTQTPHTHNQLPPEGQKWKPAVQSSEPIHHRPTPPLRLGSQQMKNPSAHWNWNLFNIFRVENITYTTTKTEYITTRVEDPNSVVSFYIRGCRPSRLPFNLPECPKPQVQGVKQDESIVVMAPLKFVSSDTLIIPSKPKNVNEIKEEEKEKEEERKREEEEEEEKDADENQTKSEK